MRIYIGDVTDVCSCLLSTNDRDMIKVDLFFPLV